MPDTNVAVAIPAAPSPMPAPPPMPAPLHPMDPRRGENLSPMFCAFLCWLLDLQSMTTPAITGIAISGSSVLAATTDDPSSTPISARSTISSATCAAGARPAPPIPP